MLLSTGTCTVTQLELKLEHHSNRGFIIFKNGRQCSLKQKEAQPQHAEAEQQENRTESTPMESPKQLKMCHKKQKQEHVSLLYSMVYSYLCLLQCCLFLPLFLVRMTGGKQKKKKVSRPQCNGSAIFTMLMFFVISSFVFLLRSLPVIGSVLSFLVPIEVEEKQTRSGYSTPCSRRSYSTSSSYSDLDEPPPPEKQ